MKVRSRSVVLLLAVVLVAAAVVGVGCTDKNTIALVNGQPIKITDVTAQLDQMKKASPATFQGANGAAATLQFKAKILDSLIQLELIRQEGEKLGVSVTDKQVDDYVAQLQTQYGGATGLTDAMKQSGVSMDQLKQSIRSRLLVDEVGKKATKDVPVTDQAMKDYYDKNLALFKTSAQVHAEHILVATKDKALADEILGKVKKGGDFAALAKQYSTDPGSKDKGGDLGWSQASTYVPEFAAAVTAMKVGEVRAVETQYGWHVIKLLETKPEVQKSFEEVKAQIQQTLQQQGRSEQFAKFVADLRKKAKIEVTDAELKKAMDAESASTTSTTVPAQ